VRREFSNAGEECIFLAKNKLAPNLKLKLRLCLLLAYYYIINSFIERDESRKTRTCTICLYYVILTDYWKYRQADEKLCTILDVIDAWFL